MLLKIGSLKRNCSKICHFADSWTLLPGTGSFLINFEQRVFLYFSFYFLIVSLRCNAYAIKHPESTRCREGVLQNSWCWWETRGGVLTNRGSLRMSGNGKQSLTMVWSQWVLGVEAEVGRRRVAGRGSLRGGRGAGAGQEGRAWWMCSPRLTTASLSPCRPPPPQQKCAPQGPPPSQQKCLPQGQYFPSRPAPLPPK